MRFSFGIQHIRVLALRDNFTKYTPSLHSKAACKMFFLDQVPLHRYAKQKKKTIWIVKLPSLLQLKSDWNPNMWRVFKTPWFFYTFKWKHTVEMSMKYHPVIMWLTTSKKRPYRWHWPKTGFWDPWFLFEMGTFTGNSLRPFGMCVWLSSLVAEHCVFLFILAFIGRWEDQHEWRHGPQRWGRKGERRARRGGTGPLLNQVPAVWRRGHSARFSCASEAGQQQHWDQHQEARLRSPGTDSKTHHCPWG